MSTLAFEASTSAAGKPRPPNSRAAKMLATRLEVAQKGRMAQSFAQVVAVLMRDPQFRNLRVVDLEWLVLPPIMAGQFRVGHASRQPEAGKAQRGGVAIPVAVALWARVSPQIDKALSANLDKQVRLRPNEWTSGDIVWLIASAGHPRAVRPFLKQLTETEFKGQRVKVRLRAPDGKVTIKDVAQFTQQQ